MENLVFRNGKAIITLQRESQHQELTDTGQTDYTGMKKLSPSFQFLLDYANVAPPPREHGTLI